MSFRNFPRRDKKCGHGGQTNESFAHPARKTWKIYEREKEREVRGRGSSLSNSTGIIDEEGRAGGGRREQRGARPEIVLRFTLRSDRYPMERPLEREGEGWKTERAERA